MDSAAGKLALCPSASILYVDERHFKVLGKVTANIITSETVKKNDKKNKTRKRSK